jgi:hypothetical protein
MVVFVMALQHAWSVAHPPGDALLLLLHARKGAEAASSAPATQRTAPTDPSLTLPTVTPKLFMNAPTRRNWSHALPLHDAPSSWPVSRICALYGAGPTDEGASARPEELSSRGG